MLQFRSEFSFDGITRLSYGWHNPNHAATVLACGIPLLWAVESRAALRGGWPRALVWIIELASVVALALTFSRGGCAALIAALIFFALTYYRSEGTFFSKEFWLFLGVKFAVYIAIFVSTGVVHRFAIAANGDASITNRLELWRGGLQLINASRLYGWGRGESGLAYMQWLQDPFIETVHGGMTNSYLHIAVERGAGALLLLFAVLSIPIIMSVRKSGSSPHDSDFLIASGSGLMAFAVAGVFSTMWNVQSVTWLPFSQVFLICLLYFPNAGWQSGMSSAAYGIGVALTFCAGLYLSAALYAKHSLWQLRLLEDGGVNLFTKEAENSPPSLTFFTDGRVLGSLYGKSIRGSIDALRGRVSTFTVYPPTTMCSKRTVGLVIALGARVLPCLAATSGDLVMVCPVGVPPQSSGAEAPKLIVLPGYDEIGFAPAWRRYAERNNSATYIITGSGQDLRGRWPALLRTILMSTQS